MRSAPLPDPHHRHPRGIEWNRSAQDPTNSHLEGPILEPETTRGLDSLGLNGRAQVAGLCGTGDLTRRLMDVGFVPGAQVECVLTGSGMSAYCIRGAIIALRRSDAAGISIRC